MNKFFNMKSVIIFLFFNLVVISSAGSQLRYFDTAEPASDSIRLTILYPSVGSIKALVELKNNGLIPIENLLVIGVYHEQEETDYQKSIGFVAEEDLEWIRFHQLSGELTKDALFQPNFCTAEFDTIFKKSDGIIFFGGADLPPYIYNRKTNLLTIIETPYRSFLETSFIFHLLGGYQNQQFEPLLMRNPSFPILGICLGCQSLNVGTGGTLIQDIWSERYGKKYLDDVLQLDREKWHRNPYNDLYPEKRFISYNVHHIQFLKGGKFIDEFGFTPKDRPLIVSSHHQMAGKLGRDLKVIATSLDGKVIEAIEHKKFPNVLGVQFHPEFTILWDRSRTFCFTPADSEAVSIRTILDANPPSFEFHQKIWSWFGERLKEYHQNKKTDRINRIDRIK